MDEGGFLHNPRVITWIKQVKSGAKKHPLKKRYKFDKIQADLGDQRTDAEMENFLGENYPDIYVVALKATGRHD